MSRTSRLMALAAALALAACTDRTSPDTSDEFPQPSRDEPAAARERLARRIALAMADDEFRTRLKHDLDRSPVREGKLHFQRYLSTAHARATSAMARSSGETSVAVTLDAGRAPALELYLPVPAHRAAWTGDDRILVATTGDERHPPIAFSPSGERIVLSPSQPPDTPVLALVPVETDFDGRAGESRFQGGGGGGGWTPPPGLYMTNSHLVERFESWVKGAPEIEVHMLGQAGSSDSLTSYACAGGAAGGVFHFDQDDLDWSGNVLLISQTQINSYKAAHPGQNFRVFFVEDDDTPCQIKTDPARFSKLVKAVEAAYPLFTGGRDSTGLNLQKIWKKARVLQQLLKALASLIKTDDELIGNAVESTVAGEPHPNSNWVIKGDGNRTTGWIKLVMK
jgi:hypothetical protein